MELIGVIFFIVFASEMASADILRNGDFETPPSDLKANSSTAFFPLSRNSTLPGWSFNDHGTVNYVTAGHNVSLPGNGHAVQLGLNGSISQNFTLTSILSHYILTFTLAPDSRSEICWALTMLDVSLGPPYDFIPSSLFFLDGPEYGSETWESHSCYLGSMGGEGDKVALQFSSTVSQGSDPAASCGPIVDTVILKRFDPYYGYETEIINGGFEEGPIFPRNLSQGILLQNSGDFTQSTLIQWAVSGKVKYIDSKHFNVPEGKAAVEILSVTGGIQTFMLTEEGSKYRLKFLMGTSTNSCRGELILGVIAGSVHEYFTLLSNGTTKAQRLAVDFKANSNVTSIRFVSYQGGLTTNVTTCGPVIDKVAVSNISAAHLLGARLLPFLAILAVVMQIAALT